MKQTKICDHCGAKIVEYPHTLNKGLMRALYKVYRSGGGPINLKNVLPSLTRNEWDNFQKLKYWNLVEQVIVDGSRKKGVWLITELGKKFVTGNISLPNKVWTFRGEIVKYEGSNIFIQDITDGYKFRPEYANESISHRDN